VTRDGVVVVGYAETPIRHNSGRSAYDLAGEALSALLTTTGIPKSEIDGFCAAAALSEASNPFHAAALAEIFGLELGWLQVSSIGGASVLAGVAAAAAALREGSCRVALVMGADAPSTVNRSRYGAYRAEFQDPTGLVRPPPAFGLLLSAYQAAHGPPAEALGKIAVTQRRHALMNDNALPRFKRPLTMADYMASRMIADPLRLLDSVMFCDGANAVLLMTERTARASGVRRMARLAAYAELSNPGGAEPTPDLLETGFARAGPAALRRAGIAPRDVRMLQAYDDFTIAVLLQLEQIGFCGRGEGAAFVLGTDLGFDGALPLNTGGGQLSAGQPGLASGGLTLVEAVRQLFGEAGARQVGNATNAVVTGIGGIPHARNWMMSNVLVLEA
jgi:acetyl-CoA acetyltransferase